MPAAPKGLSQVNLGGGQTSAEANELAIAAALKAFAAVHNISDLSTVCVAAFDNANHGSTTGTLSVSSPEVNSHGLPAFPWPKLAFPQLQYPLARHEHSNREEENKCLVAFKAVIDEKRASG